MLGSIILSVALKNSRLAMRSLPVAVAKSAVAKSLGVSEDSLSIFWDGPASWDFLTVNMQPRLSGF